MSTTEKTGIFSNVGGDLAAGLVVFFVALPLCLGIALASGAPLFSGVVAGVIGGIVVGTLSKSHLSVTGPAAGLTALVLAAITDLGAYNVFLCAVIVAGTIQLGLGFLKAGSIANYLPSNVIEGMLAAIGVIIVLKQIPHAVGFDRDFEGDEAFLESAGGNTFSAIRDAMGFITPGAVVVTLVSIAILLLWSRVEVLKRLKLLPGPLVAVVAGVALNELFVSSGSMLAISNEHLVKLPATDSISGFLAQFATPDFSAFADGRVWKHGVVIAVVASIETLLCLEAVDRLDPMKRFSPPNQELKAQGVGNIVSGLLGGLPMTSVIVRSSANVNAQAKTKLSTIIHGALLLLCVALIPMGLNRIPLASLAAILILTGLKLAQPALFRKMWRNGPEQFVPFAVTILAVVFTDLLTGVALGLAVSVFLILRENLKSPYFFQRQEYHDGDIIHIQLAQEVTFLNKAAIKMTLEHLPPKSRVLIDATNALYLDYDVIELIKEFRDIKAPEREIRLDLLGFKEHYSIENTLHSHVYVENPNPAGSPNSAIRNNHTELLDDLVNRASARA